MEFKNSKNIEKLLKAAEEGEAVPYTENDNANTYVIDYHYFSEKEGLLGGPRIDNLSYAEIIQALSNLKGTWVIETGQTEGTLKLAYQSVPVGLTDVLSKNSSAPINQEQLKGLNVTDSNDSLWITMILSKYEIDNNVNFSTEELQKIEEVLGIKGSVDGWDVELN